MKKWLSLTLAICMSVMCIPFATAASASGECCLDGKWNFKYYSDVNMLPDDVTAIDFDEKIVVPSMMELQGYGTPSYYYEEMSGWGMQEDDGVRSAGIYETTFDVKKSDAGDAVLDFESFSDELEVFIDGEKVAQSKNGAIGDDFNVSLSAGKHTMVCVVKRDKSGINKKDDFALSGLTGSVNVLYSDRAEKNGNPKKVEIENGKLFIDGKETVLKGIKYTPTHPETGNSMTYEQIEKDLKLIKEYGFNTVWTSCAPNCFYDLAEKYGLYVVDEANVNSEYAERDWETAENRITQMIKKHGKFDAIIIWSIGSGDASRATRSTQAVKKLDSRPIAQEVNFAQDFEVFGNTGGINDWLNTLGEGNVGGFVDEFADKELYYTKKVYNFTVTDSVNKEKVTLDGEIVNRNNLPMLGQGSYERSVTTKDEFTILSSISNADKDRVIFETEDGRIVLETKDYRIRLTVDGKSIDADGGEGKVAAVYADGEMQLFTSRSFKSNMECEAKLDGRYAVGKGSGKVLIEYVKIYDKMLSIDELIDMTAEENCVSSVRFDDIKINKDNSYEFLAYGGDFGENPNSYYKCLTGIFTSTREPHPEATAFKNLLSGKSAEKRIAEKASSEVGKAMPILSEDRIVFKAENTEITVDFDGNITSIKKNGEELLSEAMVPTVMRDATLSEYESGVESGESWIRGNTSIADNALCVELLSTATDGKICIVYTMYENGVMTVSMQTVFADGATKPTFVGFKGAGKFDTVKWRGNEESSYPDRLAESEIGTWTKDIKDMGDNYAFPQENGNRKATELTLAGENGKTIGFNTVNENRSLWFRVLDYSSDAMYEADHDEDISHEDTAYFRIGGHIAGLSDIEKYKLNENVYGFDFEINVAGGAAPKKDVTALYINGEIYNAFATGIKHYVYMTNETVNVTADGKSVAVDDKKAVVGDYAIYFAPDTSYLSDMTPSEKSAEVALDKDFNGAKINMRADSYWEPSVSYDKGIALKNGSVTYDVSKADNHIFNAVIGKNDFDWRNMGRGWDRNMFEAACDVEISLDGQVVEKIADVSMRSGSRIVNIDVSNAKELTISVKGHGRSEQYEDAIIANAALVPKGPIILNFEKKDGKATVTVLNTDKECVDVILSASDNNTVTSVSGKIKKGLYRTMEIPAEENAVVKAYVIGEGVAEIK